jgi:hypothetical protein
VLSSRTAPKLYEVVAANAVGRTRRPDEMRGLSPVPTDGPVAIDGADAGGRSIYCRTFTADGLKGSAGRIVVQAERPSCA